MNMIIRINEGEKFWFYEGYINPIVTILSESRYTDEVYIASKKYEWLICINHDDFIIATGESMPQKLKELESINHNDNPTGRR